jgi:MFS family permease
MLMHSIQGEFLGWFFLGVGVSAVIPLLMSAAGEIAAKQYPDTIAPSEAVAMIAGISYFAFIAAPPMIGFLSDQITLRYALFVPAGLALLMAFGARYARSSDR